MWSMLIRITKVAAVCIVATVITVAIMMVKKQVDAKQRKVDQQIQQIKSESESKQQQEKDQYEQKIKDLQTQLQAKLVEKARLASIEASKTAPKATVAQVTAQRADAAQIAPNDAKMFIYIHESGNNPASVNSTGCIGLGQNCPAVKGGTPALAIACPNWRTDYACQDNWWSTVYLARYHYSWDEAVAFWQNHLWW